MKASVKQKEDVFICKLEGEIDFNNSPELRKTFAKLTEGEAKKVILDLEKVSYIDSSGLATLVEMLQKLKDSDGQLKLASLQQKVRSVFEITKLEKIFEIYPQIQQAIDSFS